MADEEHLAKIKKNVTTWNRWRKKYPGIQPDLRRANLTNAKLTNADLSGANLRGIKVEVENLRTAKFDLSFLIEPLVLVQMGQNPLTV